MINLEELGEDYLPRTNYVPDCDYAEYYDRAPGVPWDPTKKVTDFYRLASRSMLSQAGERTLISAIIPRAVGHIHTCNSVAFASPKDLLRFASTAIALPTDFYIKSSGKAFVAAGLLEQIPLSSGGPTVFVRALVLNCLTRHYSALWSQCWDPAFAQDRWAKSDTRLQSERFFGLLPDWSWNTPLRTAYERRQAMVEVDVLVAMELGLTVDELCTIYRIQFPVLRQYERNTWYDRNGRIVYLDGDQAYGLSTPDWKRKRHLEKIERTIKDETLPGGPRERTITYEAPFDQCDREDDYRTAWVEFERRRA
jgi:hypothetical protein